MTYQPEDAEIRRNALALHRAWRAAEKVWDDSDEPVRPELPDDAKAEENAVMKDYYVKSDALSLEMRTAIDAIEAKYCGAFSTPIRAAMEAAETAFNEAPGESLVDDDDGNAVVCAVSSLPIFVSDEYVRDDETNEYFLRAAVGIKPRPEIKDEIEDAA